MEQEVKKGKATDIAQFKDILPILSIGLLIIGTLNLVVYYAHFDIDIITYLEFTEVLQVQFNLFAISSVVLVFFSLYILVFSSIGPSYEQIIEYRIEFQAMHSPEQIQAIQDKNRKELKKSSWVMYLLLSALFIPYIIKLLFAYDENDGIILWGSSILLLAFIIHSLYLFFLEFQSEDKGFFSPEPKSVMARQIGLFIFLSYSSAVIAHISAVVHKSPDSSVSEVVIITEKDTIATNKNVRFVGKTKSFTFFYDVIKKRASVYPNGDIKTTHISRGIDYQKAKEKEEKPVSYYIDRVKSFIYRHKKPTSKQ